MYRILTRSFVEELVTLRRIKIYLLAVFKGISRLDYLQQVNHLLIVHLLNFQVNPCGVCGGRVGCNSIQCTKC